MADPYFNSTFRSNKPHPERQVSMHSEPMHSEPMHPEQDQLAQPSILKAILTDIQFWIPAAVLAAGIGLLVLLH